ncbi:MAG: hypothetical protein EBU29_05680 [Gammaproteobacteria bacterium]|nr:hypothetical protein [Gammaproteobacteria bacterium]
MRAAWRGAQPGQSPPPGPPRDAPALSLRRVRPEAIRAHRPEAPRPGTGPGAAKPRGASRRPPTPRRCAPRERRRAPG